MRIRERMGYFISDLVDDIFESPGCGCLTAIALAPAFLIALGIGRLCYDAREEFKGFPRLEQGYAVTEFYIPTRGDVVLVERLADAEYQEISGGRGSCGSGQISAADDEVVICGEFRYKIERDLFTEYSQSRDVLDPFVDIRKGYVQLKKVGED